MTLALCNIILNKEYINDKEMRYWCQAGVSTHNPCTLI